MTMVSNALPAGRAVGMSEEVVPAYVRLLVGQLNSQDVGKDDVLRLPMRISWKTDTHARLKRVRARPGGRFLRATRRLSWSQFPIRCEQLTPIRSTLRSFDRPAC